jgi:S1-C subfamily serine protease
MASRSRPTKEGEIKMRTCRLIAFGLLAGFLLPGAAMAQDLSGMGFLTPGKRASFGWSWSDLPGSGKGIVSSFSVAGAMDRLSAGESEGMTTRGETEVRIFKTLSASVVLVVTDESIGSGSIISRDGMIITNWHVIDGYAEVAAIFKPATPMAEIKPTDVAIATVVAFDEVADLALLKLKTPIPDRIKPIPLGDIAKVEVGDDVHAIGHPTGETWTYTKGYVSQIRPSYEWLIHTANVIQTQTPINFGNSGGPLIDDDGLLIGVNSFMSEGEGLNFAVTVDEVQAFVKRGTNRFAERAVDQAAPCETQIVFEGRNDEDDAFVRTFDRNCDGVPDAALGVPDKESEPVFFVFDDEQDGEPNGFVVDEDRDGAWDKSYWDTTGDGEMNLEGSHPDGNLMPSGYAPAA